MDSMGNQAKAVFLVLESGNRFDSHCLEGLVSIGDVPGELVHQHLLFTFTEGPC